MQALERATYEVQLHEARIDSLLSVHKECGDTIDWQATLVAEPPTEPTRSNDRERQAQEKLEQYEPGIFDKLLRLTESKRERLSRAVEEANQEDEELYQEALQTYEQEYAEWEASRELAGRVLVGNIVAYADVLRRINPFSDISELGSSVKFRMDDEDASLIESTIHVNSDEVIPSEVKRVLKSGKLSVKPMPKTKFHELYQDYICGCVLRVARELFALLPIEMAIVTAVGDLLDTKTGHMEEQPVLSVAIPRRTLEKLNFEAIDPSDSMSNFVHRMDFKQRSGFKVVEAIEPSELRPSS